MKKISIIIIFLFFSSAVMADEIVQQFKSPSFSGIATSSHYLTIDEQEKTRRDEIAEDIESALKEAEREADNTTLAKFLRNLNLNDGQNNVSLTYRSTRNCSIATI